MAASLAIDVLRGIPRNLGVQIPALHPAARWVDARVLAANTAEAYTLPTDPGAGGKKGKFFCITSSVGPVYIDFHGTAAAPSGDVTDGTSAILIHPELEPVWIVAPDGATVMSVVCGAICIVTFQVFA
jgi:hypothetical protein